jgi:hypothetical protein
VAGDSQVEFVKEQEAMPVLRECGLEPIPQGGGSDLIYLQMTDAKDVVHLHLACEQSHSQPRAGAKSIPVAKDRLATILDHIVRRLHLDQVLLIPVAKWRAVFDCVAFSLADNELWQEMDAAATVELNRRDPLLCTHGDYHTMRCLVEALFNDADSPSQGLIIASPRAALVVEVVPDGALRLSVGNPVIADEILETLSADRAGEKTRRTAG